jgi:hypothetical protein
VSIRSILIRLVPHDPHILPDSTVSTRSDSVSLVSKFMTALWGNISKFEKVLVAD